MQEERRRRAARAAAAVNEMMNREDCTTLIGGVGGEQRSLAQHAGTETGKRNRSELPLCVDVEYFEPAPVQSARGQMITSAGFCNPLEVLQFKLIQFCRQARAAAAKCCVFVNTGKFVYANHPADKGRR